MDDSVIGRMFFNRVDFPEPFGPIKPIILPGSNVKETFFRTGALL